MMTTGEWNDKPTGNNGDKTNHDDLIRRGAVSDALNDLFITADNDYEEGYDDGISAELEAIAAIAAVAASQPAETVINAGSCQPEPMYLICKHGGYYRPNCQGYTSSVHDAGRYTLAEAISETHPNGPNGPRDGMTYIPAPPLAAIDAQPGQQCCMCGKIGLSTEEDGGAECELHDGRWTCSRKCYDTACSLMVPPRDAQIAALVEAAEAAIYKYESGTGSDWKPWFDLLRAAIAAVKGGDA